MNGWERFLDDGISGGDSGNNSDDNSGDNTGAKYSEADVLKKADEASNKAVRRILDDLGYEGKDIKTIKEERAEKQRKAKEEQEEELRKNKKWETLLSNKDKEHEDAIRKERERADSYKNKYRTSKAKDSIVTEAAKQGAVNPNDVFELLKNRIEFKDDSDVYGIKNDDGQSLTTVADAVKNFLKERPHFVKSGARKSSLDEGGSGSDTGGDNKEGEESSIKTKFESVTDGKITHENMTKEFEALKENYTGKQIDRDYKDEVQKIIAKYSSINKRKR